MWRLSSVKKGFILVSHDRAFLDKCIDHVLSINRTNIEVEKGNYSSWYHNKRLRDNYEIEKNKQLIKEISSLSEAERRAGSWSDKIEASKTGNHVFDRGYVGHQAAKMMKRAKAIERRKLNTLEEKKDLLKNIEETEALKMNIIPFHKKRLIELEDLSLFYENKKIASNINLTVKSGDRLAIRGKNGSGKTTLLKLLLGKDIKHRGRAYIASGLKISYVSQDTSWLEGSLKDFSFKYGVDETILKQYFVSWILKEINLIRISGILVKDRKRRYFWQKPCRTCPYIFWDEPLNFIDVFSRIQIEELLLAYKPTIAFIEHDKVFTKCGYQRDIFII